MLQGNRQSGLSAGLPPEAVEAWGRAAAARLQALTPWLASRIAFQRRCHGDLHLGNLCLINGRPTPFDALEFSEDLASIDTGYDLAFLLMDLDQRWGRAAANRVMNRYIARSGDVGLLRGLPLWLSMRAFIRAHVTARSGDDAKALLAASQAYLDPPPPRLVAIGGLQGSGKSTLARALAPGLGAAPGALVLRSDELRKRRAGIAPETPLPPEAYSAEESAAVFATLRAEAAEALAAGHAVVADAVFQRPAERNALAALFTPFQGFWLEAPLSVLQARIGARQNDASDADLAVLEATAARDCGPIEWARLDATKDAEAQARKMLLDAPPAASP
jgi:predicted kinase